MGRIARLFSLLGFLVFALSFCYGSDLALVGATIYPSPIDAPIPNGTVLIHDGRIAALGPSNKIKLASGTQIIDCTGMFVTAGFWNSHVHLTQPSIADADHLPVDQITRQLRLMFTSWGFTTVFDLGSTPGNTAAILRRIASGAVLGPRILTVGVDLFPPHGTPIYLKDFFRQTGLKPPEVNSPEEAVQIVSRNIQNGAEGTKLFTGSFQGPGQPVINMPLDIARAAVDESHKSNKPVFAHPQNLQGVKIAVESGVDILAHTTPDSGPWPDSVRTEIQLHKMALIPTLTLWDVEGHRAHMPAEFLQHWIHAGVEQLHCFSREGGQVLFGTDAGYIEQYDTAEEFSLMHQAGLDFGQILGSLTTEPTVRFGFARRSGRLAKGLDADLAVLSADPAQDVTNFSRVVYTIRAGRIIYSAR
jgi:imidazolonepropionase-like amidohydrolase